MSAPHRWGAKLPRIALAAALAADLAVGLASATTLSAIASVTP